MKTKEELNALKEEVEALNKKLAELNDEEMMQVSGGVIPVIPGVGLPFGKAGGRNVIQERDVTDEQLGQAAGGNGFDIPTAHSIAERPRLEDSGESIDWEQLIEG